MLPLPLLQALRNGVTPVAVKVLGAVSVGVPLLCKLLGGVSVLCTICRLPMAWLADWHRASEGSACNDCSPTLFDYSPHAVMCLGSEGVCPRPAATLLSLCPHSAVTLLSPANVTAVGRKRAQDDG